MYMHTYLYHDRQKAADHICFFFVCDISHITLVVGWYMISHCIFTWLLVTCLLVIRVYRGTGFNCANLIIANREFSRVRKLLIRKFFY